MASQEWERQAYLFARHGQLDLVHADADVMIDHLSHLLRPVGVRCDSGNELAVAAGHLFAVGQVSRPWQVARVDGVAHHHVEPVLG